jgi:hypothetical protein
VSTIKSPSRAPQGDTQRLMVVVILAGLACGLDAIRRRRAVFLDTARVWDNTGSVCRQSAESVKLVEGGPGPHGGDEETWRRLAAHCQAMKQKYELAARRPWIPVPPDPPEPK